LCPGIGVADNFFNLGKNFALMIQAKWLRSITITAAVGALLIQGCRKENGIDNNNVIRTPYALYFANSEGALFNSNDGVGYKIIFPPDGYVQRSIITSGSNLLFIKRNVHLSTDNGENFNPTDLSVNPASSDQSLALDVPGHNRLYLASTRGYGVIFSEDNGRNWETDTAWDYENIPNAPLPTTFAQLKNGDLFSYSIKEQKLYKRTGKTERWRVVVPVNRLPLQYFFLSRMNNALIATDTAGIDGVLYSNDGGVNWNRYAGLPGGVRLKATYAPFDQTLLVATNGYGIYRLQNGSFVPSNNGIDLNTTVYSITAKSDTYKNEVVKNYVYIGTSTGLYRSEDGGQNWIKMYNNTDIRRVF